MIVEALYNDCCTISKIIWYPHHQHDIYHLSFLHWVTPSGLGVRLNLVRIEFVTCKIMIIIIIMIMIIIIMKLNLTQIEFGILLTFRIIIKSGIARSK